MYPDPLYGLVTELQSTGSSDLDRLMININYANPQRRLFFGGNYQLSRILNYTDSDFSLPADNYDLAAEWGPSSRDARHRFFAMANIGTPKNTRVALFVAGELGAPLQPDDRVRHQRRHRDQRPPERRRRATRCAAPRTST